MSEASKRRPVSVKVGAHSYAIDYQDLLYDREQQQEYLGRCSHPDLKISVRENRAPSQMAETVLHETLHAIDSERRLDLSEHQVDQLAAGLIACIVDNPELFGDRFIQLWANQPQEATTAAKSGGETK